MVSTQMIETLKESKDLELCAEELLSEIITKDFPKGFGPQPHLIMQLSKSVPGGSRTEICTAKCSHGLS